MVLSSPTRSLEQALLGRFGQELDFGVGGERRAVLALGAGAVMTRHTRALVRLRRLLDDEGPEELP